MVSAALGGQSVMQIGNSVQRISIDDAKTLYELATQMQNDETDDGSSGLALVRKGEKV